MRFKSQNMHSYPVFEQGSDMPSFIEGDILFTMRPKYTRDADGGEIIDPKFGYEITEPTIAALVSQGKARVGVCMECREAILREMIWIDDLDAPTVIEAGKVTGKTEFTLFVIAIEDIPFYSSDNFVPFFKGSYEVKAGEILGFTLPKTFFMERESFKAVSSVMNVILSEDIHGEFDVDVSESAINILLDPHCYNAVQVAREFQDKATPAFLLFGLYLHGVTAAVDALKKDPENESNWARVLKNILESANLPGDQHESHILAQRILRNPITQFATHIMEYRGE